MIGDVAMETITETVITESTMIGHNPSTPGGVGVGVGETVSIFDLDMTNPGHPVVVVIPGSVNFEEAAEKINDALSKGIDVREDHMPIGRRGIDSK